VNIAVNVKLPERSESFPFIGVAVALALLASGVAFVLYFRLIADIGATRALTVTYLIPVFGVLWGWLFLGETLPAAALIPLTRTDLDVTDRGAVERALATHAPAWVINTAAYHRVDDIETKDASLAFAVNEVAVGHLAQACTHRGARLQSVELREVDAAVHDAHAVGGRRAPGRAPDSASAASTSGARMVSAFTSS